MMNLICHSDVFEKDTQKQAKSLWKNYILLLVPKLAVRLALRSCRRFRSDGFSK
jgi:hypothetical protein